MDTFIQSFFNLILSLGLDLVLIIVIIAGTYLIRIFFKQIPDLFAPVIPVCLGIIVGVTNIIMFGVKVEDWIRVILGYPSVSMLLYMLFRKYVPDSTFLKPEVKIIEKTSLTDLIKSKDDPKVS